jgi:peptidoglycan/LPS O-acetylase OafA/YrhL
VRPLTVATAASPPRAHRIGFLDALRGIAVSLVLLQHVGELLFPAVRELSASTLQLGQFGVTVFFLCSGFIIPASLERGGTASRRRALATFWTGRVFRLYPLYWLSLAGAGLLVVAGRHTPEQPLTGSDWLANASMLQMLVGSPHALGLYWTLGLEMVFYLAVSVLFLLGWHQRSAVLSLAASGGCLAAAALSGPLGISAPLGAFCLATMFTGTVVHRWHTGTLGLPAVAGCVGAVLVSGGVLLAAHTATAPASEPRFAAMLAAWLAAYAVFGAGVALRHRTPPAWLRRLGTISFSVYLMQALVLAAVPALPSRYLTAVLWVAATITLSELTFRVVERPAVRLGRSLTRRLRGRPALIGQPPRSAGHPAHSAPTGAPVAA